MATDFRSPFNSMFNNLPQGHEKAFKQAIYTTAANIFVLFAGAAAIAVYFILEAFLRPLLWAVLCGTFLYPFKRNLTAILRTWLHGLHDSETPFVIGIVTIPINTLNHAYESVYARITSHYKLIVGCVIGIFSLQLLWRFGPVQSIIGAISSVLFILYEAMGYFSSFWIWTLVVGYLVAVVFLWSPGSRVYLRYISVLVWFVLILHIATAAGSLRVPLLIFLLIVISLGFGAEMKEAREKAEAQGKTFSPSTVAAWMLLHGDYDPSRGIWDTEAEQRGPPSNEAESEEGITTIKESTEEQGTDTAATKEVKKPADLPITNPHTTAKDTTKGQKRKSSSHTETRSLTNTCFIYLIWMLVLTMLWIHIWVLQLLLPMAFLIWLMKSLGYQFSSEGMLGERVQRLKASLSEWLSARRDVLAPRWITGLIKVLSRGDNKLISMLEQSLDKTTSIMFIFLLFITSSLFTVLFAVQVQQESMYLVKISGNLFNTTLHPEITQWLPNGQEMNEAMDSMVGNAYLYGRNWIASKIRDLVKGDSDGGGNSNIEEQVLEVWDRLYDSWLARISDTRQWLYRANASSQSLSKPGFDVMSADLLDYKSIYGFLTNGSTFNYGQIMTFVKDNIGTFMSVLDSIWVVLKGNMNLVLSLLTATLSLVLGGGTAILNFIISAVIFLTTLFYLLASSGETFKPLEWFSNLNPTQSGNKFSKAVEEAISGVFMASLKMAAFYGLYTWLTHTLFGINIVFIPSTLAAVFAAVPFVGTYWAALPGVLELWLIHDQAIMALCLFVFHMLPAYVVDTAIYSEIKGGHPYMTGLAIAGGIYWMGLEGAIIGPILLCCLIVAVNVYSTLLQDDTPQDPVCTEKNRPGLSIYSRMNNDGNSTGISMQRRMWNNKRESTPGVLSRSVSELS